MPQKPKAQGKSLPPALSLHLGLHLLKPDLRGRWLGSESRPKAAGTPSCTAEDSRPSLMLAAGWPDCQEEVRTASGRQVLATPWRQ